MLGFIIDSIIFTGIVIFLDSKKIINICEIKEKIKLKIKNIVKK